MATESGDLPTTATRSTFIENPDRNNIPSDIDLLRGISDGSASIYETLIASSEENMVSSQSILLALYAIRFASISTDEKLVLKSDLMARRPFDASIVPRLSPGEKAALENVYFQHRTPEDGNSSVVSLSVLERIELKSLRRLRDSASASLVPSAVREATGSTEADHKVCCVCGLESAADEGVECEQKHFICDDCLTQYVRGLSNDRVLNPQQFRLRQGRVPCPEVEALTRGGGASHCPSEPYPHGVICRHVSDSNILDEYVKGLEHMQALHLFAEYQGQLLTEMESIRSRMQANNRNHSTPEHEEKNIESAEQSERNDGQLALAREARRQELQGLADSLRTLLPDARQCRRCGYGPLGLNGCDDLLMHHQERLHNGVVRDNSCPICRIAPPANWFELPPWNGLLPRAYLGDGEVHETFAALLAPEFTVLSPGALIDALGLSWDKITDGGLIATIRRHYEQGSSVDQIRNIIATPQRSRVQPDLRGSVQNYNPRPLLCRNFLAGNCRFGERCRFSHEVGGNDTRLDGIEDRLRNVERLRQDLGQRQCIAFARGACNNPNCVYSHERSLLGMTGGGRVGGGRVGGGRGLGGRSAVGTAVAATRSNLRCDLCGITTNSVVQLTQHMDSEAHAKRLK